MLRLADLLAGLSRLADLGFGLQAGEALRSCALATGLARSLGLVAQGCSAEIGRRLVISARTAEHHVQHIYSKIGVTSRGAAALFAMEHGLLANRIGSAAPTATRERPRRTV